MALTVTVTKESVRRIQDKLYSMSVTMVLKDGATEVINKVYSGKFRTGDGYSNIKAKLKDDMNADIANYKAEQNILTNQNFTDMVTWLNSNLSL